VTTVGRVVVLPADAAPMRVEELVLPDPAPSHVVVRQFASGVCHSQLHQIHRPRKSAVVLGHESTGVVVKAGRDVTHVREGDTVILTWVPRNFADAATPPTPVKLDTSEGTITAGSVFTWADHTVADQIYVVKVPEDIARDVTAIVGCAVMTGAGAVLNTAQVQEGQSVAIFGVGGVGISAVVAARIAGAHPIIAVDLDPAKLEFARRFGATHGVNAAEGDPIARIHELTRRDVMRNLRGDPVTGADFAFDCIGVRTTMEQILPAVRRGRLGHDHGGTAVLVGIPSTPVELNAMEIVTGEKRYIGSIGGSCCPDRDFGMFLDWHKTGALDLDAMVTERFAIDDINTACTALEQGRIQGRAILDFS
jgi:Zn-dependent alcohol dehydrogenase